MQEINLRNGSFNQKVKKVLQRFEVDRAIFYGLVTKLWSLCSGPVTATVIATRFTPEIQGYYYTFATILALQVFIELGLGTVIIQFVSHEWSKLSFGKSGTIEGDTDSLSRLSSIAKIAFKWYVIAAVLVTFGVGIGGFFFFSTSPQIGINWIMPWFVLCLVEGISICLVPVWSILEGCNEVGRLYTFRFFKGFIASITVWVAMFFGAELWTAAISAIVAFLFSLYFLKRRYLGFLKILFVSKFSGPVINWHKDILPMQWRIALSWVSGYFIFSFFVPVLFKYHGPFVAGQMGMTWSIVSIVASISTSWLSPRAPQFGILIAQGKYTELDIQFWKTTRIVLGISGILALVIWLGVFVLNILPFTWAAKFSSRILPPLPTGLFLSAQFVYTIASPFSTYLRAHKKEPLMVFSIVYAVLVGCSTFFFGKNYSVTGIAAGYLIVNIILMPVLFFIWNYFRQKWHKDI